MQSIVASLMKIKSIFFCNLLEVACKPVFEKGAAIKRRRFEKDAVSSEKILPCVPPSVQVKNVPAFLLLTHDVQLEFQLIDEEGFFFGGRHCNQLVAVVDIEIQFGGNLV